MGSPLAEMVEELLGSERPSAAFRFETGSAKPEARARDDIKRAAEAIKASAGPRVRVRLIGFTEAVEAPKLNLQLSPRRADQLGGP